MVTFGLKGSDQLLKNSQLLKRAFEGNNQQQPATPTPTPLADESQTEKKAALIITAPNDNDIINDDSVTIEGNTAANSLLTLLYQDDEIIISSDDQGNFSQEIELIGGVNQIKIAAFDPTGKETIKTINLIYTTAEI